MGEMFSFKVFIEMGDMLALLSLQKKSVYDTNENISD